MPKLDNCTRKLSLQQNARSRAKLPLLQYQSLAREKQWALCSNLFPTLAFFSDTGKCWALQRSTILHQRAFCAQDLSVANASKRRRHSSVCGCDWRVLRKAWRHVKQLGEAPCLVMARGPYAAFGRGPRNRVLPRRSSISAGTKSRIAKMPPTGTRPAPAGTTSWIAGT